ncbi:hypothetical protein DFP72DRAFT_891256 [Ephemerocybe angulata]|uniref:Uncharacterized protein n=1 Tax=Ephemerocybe angulata TaxID=980116 RepID=A0A8H6MAX2_9AGAR|nr:hypothetical protein DFP72DRAFT_891256 [Tulosesus angulatus]
MSTDTKDTKESGKTCPYPFVHLFGYGKKDDDKKEEKKTSSRKFPWRAFGGLGLVTLATLLVAYISIGLLIGYYYTLWTILILPFKAAFSTIRLVVKVALWPIFLGFSLFRSAGKAVPSAAISNVLTCNNAMELQGWEVLTLLPGSDGNPAAVKYTLNSPTPHAVSVVDIDYRDTRIDILSNGKYYGSTSDFALNKTEFCGFSTGTVIIPGGKQNVEVTWSGKDVFPGTDRIVWGGERKRRVMWKKDLCI